MHSKAAEGSLRALVADWLRPEGTMSHTKTPDRTAAMHFTFVFSLLFFACCYDWILYQYKTLPLCIFLHMANMCRFEAKKNDDTHLSFYEEREEGAISHRKCLNGY